MSLPDFLINYLVFSFYSGFRKNDEMKAMEVLPILKEKVAYLSGTVTFFCWEVNNCGVSHMQNDIFNTFYNIIMKFMEI